MSSPDLTIRGALATAERALGELERVGDEEGAAWALMLMGNFNAWLGSSAEAERLWLRALERAEKVSPRRANEVRAWMIWGLWWGPTDVEQGIRRCRGDQATVDVEATRSDRDADRRELEGGFWRPRRRTRRGSRRSHAVRRARRRRLVGGDVDGPRRDRAQCRCERACVRALVRRAREACPVPGDRLSLDRGRVAGAGRARARPGRRGPRAGRRDGAPGAT